MSKLKIGIIGCGAIGSSLAKSITKDLSERASLTAFYDIDTKKAIDLSAKIKGNKRLAVISLSDLINKSDLVIEASSAKSSCEISEKALKAGRDVLIMSVGGVINKIKSLSLLARRNNSRVYIPSGAISGIDALKAARLGKLKKVTLTTTKNPFSFKGNEYVQKKGIRLDKVNKDIVLFCGNAKDAVNYFPQNINVAAVLSLAGMGASKTIIKIVASVLVKRNIHEIKIESEAGTIFTRTENVLHPDNPKTSYLAVLAAEATLRGILEPVRIGT